MLQVNIKLSNIVSKLEDQENLIPEKRKAELVHFAGTIRKSREDLGFAKLIFVCTHNSRRSQLGQLWMRAAAKYYGIQDIYTYSGGTESTAFNHRMVSAVDRAGFLVNKLDEWNNPKYLVHLSDTDENLDIYFSKKYDDSYNPQSEFIAVMVCSAADEACPIVPGAEARISLPYLDPKAADDTARESEVYDEKVLEIGRELLFVVRNMKK